MGSQRQWPLGLRRPQQTLCRLRGPNLALDMARKQRFPRVISQHFARHTSGASATTPGQFTEPPPNPPRPGDAPSEKQAIELARTKFAAQRRIRNWSLHADYITAHLHSWLRMRHQRADSALGQVAGTILHPFPSSLCSMIARARARAACAASTSARASVVESYPARAQSFGTAPTGAALSFYRQAGHIQRKLWREI